MDISPGPTSLASLINKSPRGLTIPALQRGYEWEKNNVDQFIHDIRESSQSGASHFFGPVVVLNKDGKRTEIIDGQQRITTAFVALSLLRDEVDRLKQQVLHANTPDQIPVLSLLRNDLFFTHSDGRVDVAKPRFVASRLIRSEFTRRILQDPFSEGQARPEFKKNGPSTLGPDLVRDTKDLRSALFRIKAFLEEFLPKDETNRLQQIYNLRKALLDDFQIFTLEVKTDDDAYSLFETLNDRGLRLSAGDLLRTVLLRGIADDESPDEAIRDAIEQFDEIRKALGPVDLSRFMRHFLLTTTTDKVQQTRVMELFRQRIKSFGPDGSRVQLEELRAASEHYSVADPRSPLGPHSDSFIAGSVNRLHFLNETHRVALLGALVTRPNPSASDLTELRLFFRSVEFLTFRWLLDDGNAQKLEGHYQSLLKAFRGDPAAAADGLDGKAAADYAQKVAPKNKTLETKAFATTDRGANLRYVLYRLEQLSSPEPFSSKSVTLEHLAPAKPPKTSTWFQFVAPLEAQEGETTYAELVEQWGNCTLLPFSLNSSLSNSEWPKKLEGKDGKGLSKSRLNINQSICEIQQWTRQHIEHRTAWLSNMALSLVSKEWLMSGKEPRSINWSPPL